MKRIKFVKKNYITTAVPDSRSDRLVRGKSLSLGVSTKCLSCDNRLVLFLFCVVVLMLFYMHYSRTSQMLHLCFSVVHFEQRLHLYQIIQRSIICKHVTVTFIISNMQGKIADKNTK